jgi:ribosomal protein L22
MSDEQEKDDVSAPDTPEAKKPSGKKAAKKPAKAAKGAEARASGKAEGKAKESAKPAAKKAAKKPAGKTAANKAPKEPVASEPKKASRGKAAPAKPRRKVVRAHARYVRTSARKARMVCGHLRGKSVQEARAILEFTPREVARDWSKLLESAVANAESNHELVEEDLIVREAFADEGPTIKRFRPRAMGRATPIRKRTSHLTIALTPDPAPRTTKRDG